MADDHAARKEVFDLAVLVRNDPVGAAEKIIALRANRKTLIDVLECEMEGWLTLAQGFEQTGGSSLVPLLVRRAESLRAVINEEKGSEL